MRWSGIYVLLVYTSTEVQNQTEKMFYDFIFVVLLGIELGINITYPPLIRVLGTAMKKEIIIQNLKWVNKLNGESPLLWQ